MSEQRTDEAAARWLRVGMAAGSLYDLAFAVVLLFLPGIGADFFGIPMPAEQIYLRFIGVFLAILALFYMLPVIQTGLYLGNVVVAILGRSAGALFMFVAVWVYGQPQAFALLGAGDLAFALLHLYFLARAEGGNPFRHYLG